MKVLTTITPYWNRPDALACWLACVADSPPEVHHLLYVVGLEGLDWVETIPDNVQVIYEAGPPRSIGYYHNLGAQLALTPWIMKLDVDCLPHDEYFGALLPLLESAGPRVWFNAGMFYVNNIYSKMMLGSERRLTVLKYRDIMSQPRSTSATSYVLPAATNFVCRRSTYLELGGCLESFKGYGWEDYQQIYMLEAHARGADPLPGPLSLVNVTGRCRDEISRPKAKELWQLDGRLCLLHKYHKGNEDPAYKGFTNHNRQLLFDYICSHRYGKTHRPNRHLPVQSGQR